MVDAYWGSYVLLLQTGRSDSIVFRGPMSALPCFHISCHNVHVMFSQVEDCFDLSLIPLTINWDCVRAQAAGGDYLSRETAITEIATLVSGDCLKTCRGTLAYTLYWNPSSLRPAPSVQTVGEAVSLLRDATQLCIDAWTSVHETVVLQLSGGFDSSVLLACMRRAPTRPNVIPVNFWSAGSGDERRFARSMTELTETELIEMERDSRVDLRRFLTCARTGNPVLNFSAFDSEPRLIEVAQTRGATAILNGECGDDIFGHAPGPAMLAECWASSGLRPQFLTAAADYGELTRVSVWHAISQAFRYVDWQRRTPYWSYYLYKDFRGILRDIRLVSDDAARDYEQMLTRFVHPWFEDVREMPLGRTMLLFALMVATSTWSHSAFGGSDGGLFMSPLASQPLVEAFLRIPCRFHFRDAENGAVARRAFETMLSGAVLARGTGKGTPEIWNQEVIARNRRFLREMLLDGVLVRERVLDKGKVDMALSDGVTKFQAPVIELIAQMYIEAWVQKWMSTDVRAVA